MEAGKDINNWKVVVESAGAYGSIVASSTSMIGMPSFTA